MTLRSKSLPSESMHYHEVKV